MEIKFSEERINKICSEESKGIVIFKYLKELSHTICFKFIIVSDVGEVQSNRFISQEKQRGWYPQDTHH